LGFLPVIKERTGTFKDGKKLFPWEHDWEEDLEIGFVYNGFECESD